MEFLIVLIAILLATVILVGVGDRFNLPWPVLLTIATGAVIFVPGVPEVTLDAELILPIFLPPLLWALGQRASWQMFRTNWRAIVVYSVVLVVLTILAVIWTSMIFIPGMTIAAAVAIGAAVAPPDPVAVEAVAEPVGIPRRIVATLQTEGLFNDAVSLVAFQAALAAITSHSHLSPGALGLQFVYTAVAAVGVGLLMGWLGAVGRRRLAHGVGRSALTLVIPFAVYIVAEEVHASGVIAVVVAAVQMSSSKGDLEPEDRLTGAAFWEVVEMLLTGVAFGLIGLQLRQVIDDAGDRIGEMVLHGVIISAVVILLRLAWTLLIAALSKVGRSKTSLTPRTFGESLVMTWAGMRGLVTLALALSLPVEDFPFHAEGLVIAAVVLLFTMVFPGLTLPLLVRMLGLGREDWQDRQERRLLERAQRAALVSLKDKADEAPPEIVATVTEMYRRMVPKKPSEVEDQEAYRRQMKERKERRALFAQVRDDALAAAQDEVIRARSDRGVDPAAVDRVLHQLDQMAAVNNPDMYSMIALTRQGGTGNKNPRPEAPGRGEA
ncbi:Na+/H+ antiporter [Rothia halotolerans]|uniref:Na+/H+ antiporter n=1 Tax=Rothia halotolerans TaxID=405770 RepID=UPI00101BE305|nr:Na+/H+ antiporter [Rothia halotolerans]